MKKILMVFIATWSLLSTVALAKNLKQVEDPQLEILNYLTDVRTIPLGNYSARLITLSSFAEPEESYYLLISHDAGFDPEEKNTALFDLKSMVPAGAKLLSLRKNHESNQLLATFVRSNKQKTVKININEFVITVE
jgi:hypothetical protein